MWDIQSLGFIYYQYYTFTAASVSTLEDSATFGENPSATDSWKQKKNTKHEKRIIIRKEEIETEKNTESGQY